LPSVPTMYSRSGHAPYARLVALSRPSTTVGSVSPRLSRALCAVA
jgi:hypothetical protein